jgi:hypothetical protein
MNFPTSASYQPLPASFRIDYESQSPKSAYPEILADIYPCLLCSLGAALLSFLQVIKASWPMNINKLIFNRDLGLWRFRNTLKLLRVEVIRRKCQGFPALGGPYHLIPHPPAYLSISDSDSQAASSSY